MPLTKNTLTGKDRHHRISIMRQLKDLRQLHHRLHKRVLFAFDGVVVDGFVALLHQRFKQLNGMAHNVLCLTCHPNVSPTFNGHLLEPVVMGTDFRQTGTLQKQSSLSCAWLKMELEAFIKFTFLERVRQMKDTKWVDMTGCIRVWPGIKHQERNYDRAVISLLVSKRNFIPTTSKGDIWQQSYVFTSKPFSHMALWKVKLSPFFLLPNWCNLCIFTFLKYFIVQSNRYSSKSAGREKRLGQIGILMDKLDRVSR